MNTPKEPRDTAPDFPLAQPTVAVFSQTNHEMVVLGLIHRLGCPIVFLTDSRGSTRGAGTEEALRRIGHQAPVIFLDHSENEFYRALLRRDERLFAAVADRLAACLRDLRAKSVLTVPVEFYNPIHDTAPAVVRRAIATSGLDAALYEAPLIYQSAGDRSYRINRFPPATQQTLTYSVPRELADLKFDLYRDVYHDLRAYLEKLGCPAPREAFGTEHYRRAPAALEAPDSERMIRYEERGMLLRKTGAVGEVISYREHFLPAMTRLLALGAR
jgi:hypothetical protein